MKKITTNLMVEDVNKSIDYYVNILGFKFTIRDINGYVLYFAQQQ
jgi:catechol 2,3-dioxygenase-like lactoylglutathione lyase family enzyme